MRLEGLTDKELVEQSKGEVTNYTDYNLTVKPIKPEVGGLYDAAIFGSINHCPCGIQQKFGKCSVCGAEVVSYKQATERMGHYVLNFPYVSYVKIPALIEYILSLGEVYDQIRIDGSGKKYPINSSNLISQNCWNYKFKFEPVNEYDQLKGFYVTDIDGVESKLTITRISDSDSADDYIYCGWLGLYKLINRLPKLGTFINQVLPILPAILRPMNINNINGQYELQFDPFNQYLVAIIKSDKVLTELMPNIDNIYDRLVLVNMMNQLINEMFQQYKIVAPSKESLVRGILAKEVGQSGRAVIVGCPDLPANKIRLPRSLSYYSLSDQIIKSLRDKGLTKSEAEDKYLNMDEQAKAIHENVIVPNSCVAFCRNPSISKNSVLAFRVELWDEIAIGIPLLACKQYNADFDGDTMAYWYITNPIDADKTIRKMGVENNWFYESTGEATLAPNASILQGLYLASVKRQNSDNPKQFETYEDLERSVTESPFETELDELVVLNGEFTTYGRQKISKIIQIDYDILLGDNPITAKNISNLMSAIFSKNNKIEILKNLVLFANETITELGSTSISLTDIFEVDVTSDKRYQDILKSDDSDEVKFTKLVELLPEIMKEKINSLTSPTLKGVIEGSGRIKLNQLVESLGPRIEYDKNTGLTFYSGSLGLGTTEPGFVSIAQEDRDILGLKKSLIPETGYLQRQLTDVCGEFLFTKEPSQSKLGAILKKKDAVGRTLSKNGEIIQKNDSDELVRVLSCIDSPSEKISYEELDQLFPEYRKLEENQPIGISFSSAASHNLIQSSLGLKHGGSLISPSKTKFRSPIEGTIISRDNTWLSIKGNDGVIYKIPVPDKINWEKSVSTNSYVKFKQILGYEDKLVRIEQTLADIFKILGSYKSVKGVKPNELNLCYATTSGNIHYDIEGSKKLVKIGDMVIPFDKELIYMYPEGAYVNKGSRFSSGLINLTEFYNRVNGDDGWTYYVFLDQIHEIVGLKDIKSELFEVIYKGIRMKDVFSIRKSMTEHSEFLVQLKHGYGTSKIISKFVDKNIGEGFTTELLIGSQIKPKN